jgi:vancomycin resistance protein VanJ
MMGAGRFFRCDRYVILYSMAARRKIGLLTIATTVNLALLLSILAVEIFVSERHPWGTFLTYMPQQPFILPTVLLITATILRRRWRTLIWNLPALTVCMLLLGVNIPLPGGHNHGASVRLMTWNVNRLNRGIPAIVETIMREKPDIVCLEEVREMPTLQQSAALQRAFPDWEMVRGDDVAILSRYPITRHVPHTIANTERVILEARLDIQGTPITVIATHYVTGIDGRSLTDSYFSRHEYLQQSSSIRATQTRSLLDIAGHAGTPVLIAGDFNTPPRGIIYHTITSRYQDAFRVAGFGTGYTFPASLPLMRIDHIFASQNLRIVHCARIKSPASDHLPLVADVQLDH